MLCIYVNTNDIFCQKYPFDHFYLKKNSSWLTTGWWSVDMAWISHLISGKSNTAFIMGFVQREGHVLWNYVVHVFDVVWLMCGWLCVSSAEKLNERVCRVENPLLWKYDLLFLKALICFIKEVCSFMDLMTNSALTSSLFYSLLLPIMFHCQVYMFYNNGYKP